jgi:hypothetical protein
MEFYDSVIKDNENVRNQLNNAVGHYRSMFYWLCDYGEADRNYQDAETKTGRRRWKNRRNDRERHFFEERNAYMAAMG